jgi:hypothetical protein
MYTANAMLFLQAEQQGPWIKLVHAEMMIQRREAFQLFAGRSIGIVGRVLDIVDRIAYNWIDK